MKLKAGDLIQFDSFENVKNRIKKIYMDAADSDYIYGISKNIYTILFAEEKYVIKDVTRWNNDAGVIEFTVQNDNFNFSFESSFIKRNVNSISLDDNLFELE